MKEEDNLTILPTPEETFILTGGDIHSLTQQDEEAIANVNHIDAIQQRNQQIKLQNEYLDQIGRRAALSGRGVASKKLPTINDREEASTAYNDARDNPDNWKDPDIAEEGETASSLGSWNSMREKSIEELSVNDLYSGTSIEGMDDYAKSELRTRWYEANVNKAAADRLKKGDKEGAQKIMDNFGTVEEFNDRISKAGEPLIKLDFARGDTTEEKAMNNGKILDVIAIDRYTHSEKFKQDIGRLNENSDISNRKSYLSSIGKYDGKSPITIEEINKGIDSNIKGYEEFKADFVERERRRKSPMQMSVEEVKVDKNGKQIKVKKPKNIYNDNEYKDSLTDLNYDKVLNQAEDLFTIDKNTYEKVYGRGMSFSLNHVLRPLLAGGTTTALKALGKGAFKFGARAIGKGAAATAVVAAGTSGIGALAAPLIMGAATVYELGSLFYGMEYGAELVPKYNSRRGRWEMQAIDRTGDYSKDFLEKYRVDNDKLYTSSKDYVKDMSKVSYHHDNQGNYTPQVKNKSYYNSIKDTARNLYNVYPATVEALTSMIIESSRHAINRLPDPRDIDEFLKNKVMKAKKYGTLAEKEEYAEIVRIMQNGGYEYSSVTNYLYGLIEKTERTVGKQSLNTQKSSIISPSTWTFEYACGLAQGVAELGMAATALRSIGKFAKSYSFATEVNNFSKITKANSVINVAEGLGAFKSESALAHAIQNNPVIASSIADLVAAKKITKAADLVSDFAGYTKAMSKDIEIFKNLRMFDKPITSYTWSTVGQRMAAVSREGTGAMSYVGYGLNKAGALIAGIAEGGVSTIKFPFAGTGSGFTIPISFAKGKAAAKLIANGAFSMANKMTGGAFTIPHVAIGYGEAQKMWWEGIKREMNPLVTYSITLAAAQVLGKIETLNFGNTFRASMGLPPSAVIDNNMIRLLVKGVFAKEISAGNRNWVRAGLTSLGIKIGLEGAEESTQNIATKSLQSIGNYLNRIPADQQRLLARGRYGLIPSEETSNLREYHMLSDKAYNDIVPLSGDAAWEAAKEIGEDFATGMLIGGVMSGRGTIQKARQEAANATSKLSEGVSIVDLVVGTNMDNDAYNNTMAGLSRAFKEGEITQHEFLEIKEKLTDIYSVWSDANSTYAQGFNAADNEVVKELVKSEAVRLMLIKHQFQKETETLNNIAETMLSGIESTSGVPIDKASVTNKDGSIDAQKIIDDTNKEMAAIKAAETDSAKKDKLKDSLTPEQEVQINEAVAAVNMGIQNLSKDAGHIGLKEIEQELGRFEDGTISKEYNNVFKEYQALYELSPDKVKFNKHFKSLTKLGMESEKFQRERKGGMPMFAKEFQDVAGVEFIDNSNRKSLSDIFKKNNAAGDVDLVANKAAALKFVNDKINALDKKNEELIVKAEEAQKIIDTENAKMPALELKIKDYALEIDENKKKIDENNKDTTEAEAELFQLNAAILEIDKIEEEKRLLEYEIAQNKTKLASLNQGLSDRNKEISDLEKEVLVLETNNANSTNKGQRLKGIKSKKKELTNKRNELQYTENDILSLTNEVNNESQALATKTSELQAREQERKDKLAAIQIIEEKIDKNKNVTAPHLDRVKTLRTNNQGNAEKDKSDTQAIITKQESSLNGNDVKKLNKVKEALAKALAETNSFVDSLVDNYSKFGGSVILGELGMYMSEVEDLKGSMIKMAIGYIDTLTGAISENADSLVVQSARLQAELLLQLLISNSQKHKDRDYAKSIQFLKRDIVKLNLILKAVLDYEAIKQKKDEALMIEHLTDNLGMSANSYNPALPLADQYGQIINDIITAKEAAAVTPEEKAAVEMLKLYYNSEKQLLSGLMADDIPISFEQLTFVYDIAMSLVKPKGADGKGDIFFLEGYAGTGKSSLVKYAIMINNMMLDRPSNVGVIGETSAIQDNIDDKMGGIVGSKISKIEIPSGRPLTEADMKDSDILIVDEWHLLSQAKIDAFQNKDSPMFGKKLIFIGDIGQLSGAMFSKIIFKKLNVHGSDKLISVKHRAKIRSIGTIQDAFRSKNEKKTEDGVTLIFPSQRIYTFSSILSSFVYSDKYGVQLVDGIGNLVASLTKSIGSLSAAAVAKAVKDNTHVVILSGIDPQKVEADRKSLIAAGIPAELIKKVSETQGLTYDNVYVFSTEGDIIEDQNISVETNKALLTAVSRARNKVVMVGDMFATTTNANSRVYINDLLANQTEMEDDEMLSAEPDNQGKIATKVAIGNSMQAYPVTKLPNPVPKVVPAAPAATTTTTNTNVKQPKARANKATDTTINGKNIELTNNGKAKIGSDTEYALKDKDSSTEKIKVGGYEFDFIAKREGDEVFYNVNSGSFMSGKVTIGEAVKKINAEVERLDKEKAAAQPAGTPPTSNTQQGNNMNTNTGGGNTGLGQQHRDDVAGKAKALGANDIVVNAIITGNYDNNSNDEISLFYKTFLKKDSSAATLWRKNKLLADRGLPCVW